MKVAYTNTNFRDPCPNHAGAMIVTHCRDRSRIAGIAVRIQLPPRVPSPGKFTCGTSWEWRIHPEDAERITDTGASDFDSVWACEHQLELD